jgi:hypothetical protein
MEMAREIVEQCFMDHTPAPPTPIGVVLGVRPVPLTEERAEILRIFVRYRPPMSSCTALHCDPVHLSKKRLINCWAVAVMGGGGAGAMRCGPRMMAQR